MKKESKNSTKVKQKSIKNDESFEEKSHHIDSFPITIDIESIENVDPKFLATDVYILVHHHRTSIGQTENTYVLDKTFVELNSSFQYLCNISQPKELDNLLTYPIHFMVWQTLNKLEYENLDIIVPEPSVIDDDILSSQEMLLGVKEHTIETPHHPRSIKSSKKGGTKDKEKTPRKEKSQKESTKDTGTVTRVSVSTESIFEDPVCVGSGTVDLMPFFKGETEITEIVPIYQKKMFIDERFKHGSLCPQLNVTIKITEPLLELLQKNMTNSFQISFEEMHNCPDDINDGYEFKLATVYPMETMTLEQFYFDMGVYKSGGESVAQMKFWPNLSTIDDLGSQTKQIIESDLSTIKNKIDVDLQELMDSKPSRVVWNSIKRSWLSLDANDYLKQLITRYRVWPIEIKMIPVTKKGVSTVKVEKKKPEKKSTDAASLKDAARKSRISMRGLVGNYHLMAYADISTLLYPGVTKTRVVCPLYNFCQQELTHHTGYESSCFSNYTNTIAMPPDLDKEVVEKEGKSPPKEEKASKASKKEKPPKKVKEPVAHTQEVCESELVRSSSGICFIIIEAELMFPFMKRRTIEDLSAELMTIIPKRAPLPKSVIPMRVAVNMFKTTICEMTREINKEFQYYTQELDHVKIKEVTTPCFIKYLQEKGTYQKMLMTVGQSITMLIKEKFKYTEEQQTEYMYDNYISMIYVYLINEMNKQINSIMNCNLTGCSSRQFTKQDHFYLCDEAIELDMPVLAEKYHLQMMKDNQRSPDHWFNLAVFYKGQRFFDRAYECCKEGLALKSDHKLCLLLFGGMLYEKQDYLLAETTLLAVVHHHPECLEAWVGLFIVYYHKTKFEGCDVCMEHINKYKARVIQIDNQSSSNDYNEESRHSNNTSKLNLEERFKKYEPLGWSTQIAARTPFFHCAIIFIKMHILQFAEQSLLFDRVELKGEHKYYLGVIRYFQKNYALALEVLYEAQKTHGPDFAVNSMIGHCNFRLGNFAEAKESYEFIVCAYNRPEDMHMLYTNLALIYEKEDNLEMARKYLLLVCKMSSTPYSWLLLGIVLFKEGKLKEAEACVAESNNLDNRLPETWAYLVLINIKLGKVWEAQQCFSQMIKYDLQDKSLLALVVIEMKMAKSNSK